MRESVILLGGGGHRKVVIERVGRIYSGMF